MRTIASQMKDAEGRSVSIKIDATASTGEKCEFTSSGRVITFHGFLKAYVEGADDPSAGTDDQETRLPDVAEGDVLPAVEVLASGHETKPPARFTEATLIREMEEREIGRPSTYASILGTNLARGYVYKKGTGAGAGLPGLRGGPPAGGALHPAGRLRLHRLDGGRARRGRRR